MAHGFGGVKELRLDAYAERFAEAGYNVLVFDYRHFGTSDGDPRQLLDIKKQHQDWIAALEFARSLNSVDKNAIALWGTSFSGGHVIEVAVRDGRVAAVISQVPFINGMVTARANGIIRNLRLGLAGIRDLFHQLFGWEPYYVKSIGEPGELAAINAPGEAEAMQRLYPKGFEPENRIAARIFLKIGLYIPVRFAPMLKIPWLVQVAGKDMTTPPQPAIKAARQTPMAELIIYDLGHFEVYVDPAFEKTVADQIAFLKRHIQPGLSSAGSNKNDM
jgi:fermentation-respiration switch protein FrsA (DUF1100 family)